MTIILLPRLTVYPVMPTTNLQDSQSDRAVLSRPSLVLVTWLLDSSLDNVTKVIMIQSKSNQGVLFLFDNLTIFNTEI